MADPQRDDEEDVEGDERVDVAGGDAPHPWEGYVAQLAGGGPGPSRGGAVKRVGRSGGVHARKISGGFCRFGYMEV